MRFMLPLFLFPLALSAPAIAIENVPVPRFLGVELRGGGEVVLRPGPAQRVTLLEGTTPFTGIRVMSDGKLRIDTCNQRCPYHYRMRALVESPAIPATLAVRGGGTVTAAPGFGGRAPLTLAVSGGGVIDTKATASDVVTAAVNGGGQIKVRSLRVLTAAVNGGGEIRYLGNPVVTSAIHGGGAIQPGG